MRLKGFPGADFGENTGDVNPFVANLFYAVTATEGNLEKIQARMIVGDLEDPATGSAACALGAFRALTGQNLETRFEVTQGVEMGRKSEIEVEVIVKEGGEAVDKIFLAGRAVNVMQGELEI